MNATIRTTCTDADTRSAYAALLNAQIATQVAGQTRTMGKVATALNDYRGRPLGLPPSAAVTRSPGLATAPTSRWWASRLRRP
jgi:hypothetical protein